MVDMLIIIQNIYETNLLHNMLSIEINADGEFGLLPKLENNVRGHLGRASFCFVSSLIHHDTDSSPLYSGFRVKFVQVT